MNENSNSEGEVQSLTPSFIAAIQWFIDLFYLSPLRKYIAEDRFRYFFCGGCNYIILDGLLYFLTYHLVIAGRYINIGITTISPHVASLIIVFPITFCTGFLLNRYVVFEASSRKIKFQLARYALTVIGSIVLNYLIIKILVEQIGIWATPSKIICSLLTAIYSYVMARYFTFTVKKAGSDCVQTK